SPLLPSRRMGESSRRSRKRHSRRKERRSKPASPTTPPRRKREEESASSPPSYSVEENSQGEWVNSRLNVKWPEPVDNYSVSKHRYLTLDDSPRDRKQSERRSRKKRSKREKKDRKKRDGSEKSSRTGRSPMCQTEKEAQYITLSIGSEKEDSSDRSKRLRRERKRMVVQTSPQASKKSFHSGYHTDEDGKKIDTIVFDTQSEMMRYRKSDDILPTTTARRSTRSKKPSAADQRENEEYNRYYVGVRSRRSVENKLNRPGEFALYYEKLSDGAVPGTVNLTIAYLSSGSQEYHHFPVQCFKGGDGRKNYVVMQNKSDGKMFTSVLSLVKHYSLYSHVDTSTGRLETFSVPY
ncbi:hypothetical protein PENTCL1PPCAC_5537, partial [Pristionchus entomophagus]